MKIVDNKKEFSVKEFLKGKVIYFEGSQFFLVPNTTYIISPDIHYKSVDFECKNTKNKYSISVYDNTLKFIIDNKRYYLTDDSYDSYNSFYRIVEFVKCLYFYVNNLSLLVNDQISFERTIKQIIHGKSSRK